MVDAAAFYRKFDSEFRIRVHFEKGEIDCDLGCSSEVLGV